MVPRFYSSLKDINNLFKADYRYFLWPVKLDPYQNYCFICFDFHCEEVLNDSDINLLGYNIFERIAKEGRKYGVLLGLITQRPSELSETVMSQCNNFLVFKMTHPLDSEYIKKIIPFMTNDVNQQIKILQPGNCYVFGPAFKIPLIVKLNFPNPAPNSSNVNILNTWFVKKS